MTTDEDKILNFDFHYAVCLLAVDELIEALNDLYTSIWLMVSGDDEETDKFYASTYDGLLERISEQAANLTVTDEFKQYYEEHPHDAEN